MENFMQQLRTGQILPTFEQERTIKKSLADLDIRYQTVYTRRSRLHALLLKTIIAVPVWLVFLFLLAAIVPKLAEITFGCIVGCCIVGLGSLLITFRNFMGAERNLIDLTVEAADLQEQRYNLIQARKRIRIQ